MRPAVPSGYYRPMKIPSTWRTRLATTAVQDALFAAGLTMFGWMTMAVPPLFYPRAGGGRTPRPDDILSTQPTSTASVDALTRAAGARPPRAVPTTWSFAFIAAAFLPLALRRRYPLAVLAVTSLASAGYDLIPGPPSLVFLAPLIALYTVGTLRDRRTLVIAGALSGAVHVAASLPAWGATTWWAEALRIISMLGVAAALGDATRNRRAYVAEVEQRAVEAERTRDEVARRRVDEERLRIARELHDVTAHSLSIIAVQSGAATHVLDSDPAEARRALEAIRLTSKNALDELRVMLGVLRSADETDVPLAPTPGLARLSVLFAPLAEAGVVATLEVEGDISDIPAVVDASAYRIVQEALTNVVRHAGPCTVTVSLVRSADEIAVTVTDTGRGPAGPGGSGTGPTAVRNGHGLAGMHERASALGGSLIAGPGPDGGFVVTAHLPVAARGGRSS